MSEKLDINEFENRKGDHLRIALSAPAQALGFSGLDRVRLTHEALPDLNFSEINISTESFGQKLKTPIFISSMTAGHENGKRINTVLARACESRGWMMGVGSQRRELSDSQAALEWKEVRKVAPNALMFGNLGIAQLIQSSVSDVQRLVDALEAKGLFIHLNSLQEVLQPEGTHNFKGGLEAIKNLVQKLSVPVVIKEVGCGFSEKTLKSLEKAGVYAVDVAGLGGTHWGRVEGLRSPEKSIRYQAADSFHDWGISTLDSMLNANKALKKSQIWASGGVRSGLDVAKLIALGAQLVGTAQPALSAALIGEDELQAWMSKMEFELKVALFCTGSQDINAYCQKKDLVSWT